MNSSLNPYLFQEELYIIPEPVTIVLPRHLADYPEESRALMLRILAAVDLTLASVRIVIGQSVSIEEFDSLRTSKLLIFGSQINGIASYEVIQAQGFSVIQADDLTNLDETKKKSLWKAMKAMFGR